MIYPSNVFSHRKIIILNISRAGNGQKKRAERLFFCGEEKRLLLGFYPQAGATILRKFILHSAHMIPYIVWKRWNLSRGRFEILIDFSVNDLLSLIGMPMEIWSYHLIPST